MFFLTLKCEQLVVNSAAKCTYTHKSQEHRLWVQFSARQEQIVSLQTGLRRHYADVYMDFLLSYPLQLLTEFLSLYILFYIFAHCCLQFVLFWKHLTFSFCLRRYAMKHYFWRKALTCLVNSNLVYPPNDLIVVTWSTFRFFRTRDEAMQILLADMFKVAF